MKHTNPLRAYCLYMEFEGFSDYSYDDFENVDFLEFLQTSFNGQNLPADWKLPKHTLGNPQKAILDFVNGYLQAPFVSQRVADILGDRLIGQAEFRHVGKLKGKEYYVMNVIRLCDCLDLQNSKYRVSSADPSKIIAVDQFAFVPDRIPNVPLFKVPQDTGRIFATDTFVDWVREYRFTGVGFEDPANLGLTRIEKVFSDLPLT